MTLISLALVLSLVLIILALVYFGNKHTRKQKKILWDEVEKAAANNNLVWDKTDLSRNRALAWNGTRQIFFHCNLAEDRPLSHLIIMDDIRHCELAETIVWEQEKNKKQTHKNVTELGLQFFFKDKTGANLTLGFYSEILDGVMERNNQTQKAKEWLALIGQSSISDNVQHL